VELRGQRIVYMFDTVHGRAVPSVEEILHISATSW
jgi:hypothetical protein